jgi:class 3 adenylate cyclase
MASVGAMLRGCTTALGDAVNLAFGIEKLTRDLGSPIAASRDFLSGWKEGAAKFEPCGPREIKGHAEAIEVFRYSSELPATPFTPAQRIPKC